MLGDFSETVGQLPSGSIADSQIHPRIVWQNLVQVPTNFAMHNFLRVNAPLVESTNLLNVFTEQLILILL